jgi:hypothetical protein
MKLSKTESIAPTDSKIVVEMPVSKLSALIRLLFDSAMFGTSSKIEIIRLTVNHFRTTKNEDISVNSFKNHFNVPDVDSLAYWEEFFAASKEVIKNYYMKYHSS